MTNKATTRRALFMSFVALLLCFTMLLGTTFAWFTDSVSSARNTIKSGNLDVELYYSTLAEDGTWTEYAPVDETTKIFKDGALYEPGYTEVVKFKVVNSGSLAFKYNMNVAINSETEGTNKAHETFKLSEYLYIGALESVTDRDAAAAEATVKLGSGFAIKTDAEIKAGDPAHEFVLVLTMPTTVGNEANHINGKQPTIELGVDLFATQLTYERDSFGPDYDEDALYADAVYHVNAENSFASVLSEINAAEDETVLVYLDEDVEWATGASHGSTPWINADAKVENLIIDANGSTITATGAGVGSIRMANGGTLTIQNATVVDKSVSYAEDAWEFTYLEFAGKLNVKNVVFEGGICVQTEDGETAADAVFTNCTFNANESSVYAAWVSDGNTTFTGCTFKGTRGIKTHEAYGSEVVSLVVDNCTFDNLSEKPGLAIGTLNADTTVVIKNSDFINCQPGDQNKYIYETDTDVTTFNFDCSNNNEVINIVAPALTITTAKELFDFANDVNVNGNSYAGKLVVLGADIDLENAEWTPIGQTGGNGAATYFQGMFDGKGYTISNLKITNNSYDEGGNYAAGLFGFIDAADAQIVNLNISNASVSAHHWTGVIAGYLSGKITGCTVSNATVVCTHVNDDACGDKAGVITGYVNSGVVTGNTVKDCTVTAGRDAGQVVGCAKTTQAYDNTIYNVTVTAGGDCTGANISNSEIGRLN